MDLRIRNILNDKIKIENEWYLNNNTALHPSQEGSGGIYFLF